MGFNSVFKGLSWLIAKIIILLCQVLKYFNCKQKTSDVNWLNKRFVTFFIRRELFAHLNIHC